MCLCPISREEYVHRDGDRTLITRPDLFLAPAKPNVVEH